MRTFTLNDKQEKDFITWRDEHLKTCTVKGDFSGAWCKVVFVPSGLGDSASVECFCGARVHLDSGEEL